MGLSKEGYLFGDFLKFSLGAPFALFQKMRVLGDLAKNVLTWPFGALLEPLFCPKLFSRFCPLNAY